MRPIRSSSPPPRSLTPEPIPHPLPSPRRRPSKLTLSPNDLNEESTHLHTARSPTPRKNLKLRSSRSAEPLVRHENVTFDLRFDEFGGGRRSKRATLGENTVEFPGMDKDSGASCPALSKRGHRRSSALYSPRPSPRSATFPTPSSHRTRSRSPPPMFHKSPPPPLPPIPSFLLTAAHKKTDEGGLRHIYLPDIEFGYSLSSSKASSFGSTAEPLTHLKFFAAMHHGPATPVS